MALFKSTGRITNNAAINMLTRRIEWLIEKTILREAKGEVAELYRLEIKAYELAILAIEERKKSNIFANGGNNG